MGFLAFAVCTSLQLGQWALVPKGSPSFGGVVWFGAADSATSYQRSVQGARFPYVVPVSKTLRIGTLHFSSKNLGSGIAGQTQSSYATFSVQGIADSDGQVVSIPEHSATVTFPVPLELPSGALLYGYFINNSQQEQWMQALVVGELCGPD